MAMTLADLTTEILGLLEFDGSDDSDKFQITNNVNRAQDFLLNILPIRLIVNALDTKTDNLVISDPTYAAPADFLRPVYLNLDFAAAISATNLGRRCRFIEPENWNNLSNIDLLPSTEHPVFTIGDDGEIEIAPIPTGNVTSGYLLKYVKKLQAITTGTDCLLRDNLRNMLVFKTVQFCAMTDGYSPDLAAMYKDIFKEELEFHVPDFKGKEI
jgi:hypothetical protein